MKKRIALLGGSFDPVHNGHIAMADAALKHLGVEEVWFLPALQSPLKDHALTRTADRLNMLRTVCRDHPRFKICDVDLRRHGISYTVDTLEILTRRYPEIEFVWLLGEDQARQFDRWKNPERLRELAQFAVAVRPAAPEDEFFEQPASVDPEEQKEAGKAAQNMEEQEDRQPSKEQPGGQPSAQAACVSELPEGFIPLPMEPVDVSSTAIRHGKRLNLMPESIRQYLLDHELYLVQWIQPQMNPHRFAHSNSVARLCREMAQAHGFDPHRAWLAGLFHDIAKDLPKNEQEKWIRAAFPQAVGEAPAIWHGYVGSEVVSRIYGIYDPVIKNAIACHVKGTSYDPYAMMVFIADKLDPLRGYDSAGLYKACLHDLYNGFMLVKAENKNFLEKELKAKNGSH